jgi:hypothetical protein
MELGRSEAEHGCTRSLVIVGPGSIAPLDSCLPVTPRRSAAQSPVVEACPAVLVDGAEMDDADKRDAAGHMEMMESVKCGGSRPSALGIDVGCGGRI